MTTVSQNVVAVTVTVLASLLIMAGVNRVWPRQKRHRYNDLIGWQLSILGTTYAVILGFMLYAVWTSFGEADINVNFEANAIVDVYRVAEGLPEPQRTQLQQLANGYASTVIDREWPQMALGEVPEPSPALAQMWKIVMSLSAASPTQVNAQQHAMSELKSLGERRLTRIVQSRTSLPSVLWCVLLVGGGLTIISSCAFSSDSLKLQTLQVFFFSLLISLSLVAISDVHRPFHGLIHVSDYAFQQAQEIMKAR